MSMIPSSNFSPEENEFQSVTLERQFFSTFYAACLLRKEEEGLTRADLGGRLGKDKTGTSKLLKEPANWTIHTFAIFANCLEMEFEFRLRDRKYANRYITSTGVYLNDKTNSEAS